MAVMDTATSSTTQQGPSKGSAGSVTAASEGYDAHATSTQTSSLASFSDSMGQSQVGRDSRQTSFESVRGGDEHARACDNTVQNPTSSSKRGHLRAVSLDLSPDGKLGGPTVGFGAGLRNVPPPIATKPQTSAQKTTQAMSVREPTPARQLPNINETLGDWAPLRRSQTPSGPGPNKYGNINPASIPVTEGTGLLVNPYVRRADEIGPNHGIPGVGHIGALLNPPGWKIGDEPINDMEADKLYTEAREQAAKALDAGVNERGRLSCADHLRRNAEQASEWQRQLRIDNYCQAERKYIYQRWQERQALRSRQPQQQRLIQTPARVVPAPVHPPTQTSGYAFQRHQQAQLPTSPLSSSFNSPLSAGSTNNRLHCLQRGLRFPISSPMSPSSLDPNLVPQTLDSIYAHFRANRIVIMQMHNENENFLTSWTSKFGLARPQGLPITPIPQYMNGSGQQARPFANPHPGYGQGRNIFSNPDELRVQEQGQGMPIAQTQGTTAAPIHGLSLGSNSATLRQQEHSKAPSRLGITPPLERPQAAENRLPERTVQRVGTPQLNKGPRKPSGEKPLVWCQEHTEHPYGPTSPAVQRRMQTGQEIKSKAYEQPDATQQVFPRGRKPEVDTKKGFAVSTDQAKHFIALGAHNMTNHPPCTIRRESWPGGTTIQSAPSARATSSYTQAPNGTAGSGTSAVAAKSHVLHSPEEKYANDKQPQPGLSATSRVRGDSPSPSSESPDNPIDTTLGEKSTRKAAALRAIAPGRKATTAGKKRKSDPAGSAPVKKRGRMSLDGTAECEAYDES